MPDQTLDLSAGNITPRAPGSGISPSTSPRAGCSPTRASPWPPATRLDWSAARRGKTSLLKGAGGEDDAAAGIVLKRGTLGYVPQNPPPASRSGPDVLSHILSGRVSIAPRCAWRSCTSSWRKITRRKRRAFLRAEERYRLDGGYSSESDARRIVTGLGCARPGRLPVSVLSGGEGRRVELAGFFSRKLTCCCSTADNHLDSDAKTWLMISCATTAAGIVVARPRAAGRFDHACAPPGRRAHARSTAEPIRSIRRRGARGEAADFIGARQEWRSSA